MNNLHDITTAVPGITINDIVDAYNRIEVKHIRSCINIYGWIESIVHNKDYTTLREMELVSRCVLYHLAVIYTKRKERAAKRGIKMKQIEGYDIDLILKHQTLGQIMDIDKLYFQCCNVVNIIKRYRAGDIVKYVSLAIIYELAVLQARK